MKLNSASVLAILLLAIISSGINAQDLGLDWVKTIGNDKLISGVGYTATSVVDKNGNVYTAGVYYDTLDFDPGIGVYPLSGSIYFQKLDASGHFVWAKSLNTAARINDITLDSKGNIYATGSFAYVSDFDPGPGVYNLTCTGSGGDIFILKLDDSGNFVWACSAGGPDLDRGYSIATDTSGHVYCCGSFSQTVDFDPGPGILNLSTVNESFFLMSYDQSGNFRWAKAMGFGNIFSYLDYQVSADSKGNVYTTGRYDDTADFDPGPGVYTLTASGIYSDVFIQKLDSNGNFLWAISNSGTQLEVCRSFGIDAKNNIYATGFFTQTVDFDPGPGVFNLSSSQYVGAYIQKLDESGNFLWATYTGNDSTTIIPNGITTDSNLNVYATGYFYKSIDFDPGPGVFNLSTKPNAVSMYIQKLDPAGHFTWAKSMGGGNNNASPESIVIDENNNLYLTGIFGDTVDFDPELQINELISSGNNDIFIEKLSPCFINAFSLGEDTLLCQGDTLYLHAAVSNVNYLWQDNSTDSVFKAVNSGIYSLQVSSGGCKYSDTIMIKFEVPIQVDLGNDTTLCEGEIVRLHATNSGSGYLWQDFSTDSIYMVSAIGTYYVLVTNTCGRDSDEIQINYENCSGVFIPNSFTPNGDDKNDDFYPVSYLNFSEYNFTIFNRWYEKIFESYRNDFHWNGKYNGKHAPSGVYIYKFSYKLNNTNNYIQKFGRVSLIR